MGKEAHIRNLEDMNHCAIYQILKKKNNNITNIQEEIRIIDGDTIHINKFKYRLHGIDAPEMKQLCKTKEKSNENKRGHKRIS